MSSKEVSVQDIDLGWRKLKENLLYFGITQAEVGHFDEDWHEEAEMDMASLAAMQELGFINQNGSTVPPRSFHSQTANRNQNSIGRKMGEVVSKVYAGKITVHEALVEVGEEYTEDMQQMIDDFSNPKNAKGTIKAKGVDNPLVDSGSMRDATTFKVVDRRRT